MNRKMVQHMRFKTQFISQQSPAKQQREITKNLRNLRREILTVNYLSFQFELDAALIRFAEI